MGGHGWSREDIHGEGRGVERLILHGGGSGIHGGTIKGTVRCEWVWTVADGCSSVRRQGKKMVKRVRIDVGGHTENG